MSFSSLCICTTGHVCQIQGYTTTAIGQLSVFAQYTSDELVRLATNAEYRKAAIYAIYAESSGLVGVQPQATGAVPVGTDCSIWNSPQVSTITPEGDQRH
jgi:hypothetical protein